MIALEAVMNIDFFSPWGEMVGKAREEAEGN